MVTLLVIVGGATQTTRRTMMMVRRVRILLHMALIQIGILTLGATDHITGELNKLLIANKYHGQDKVRTAKGTCMNISHTGNSILRTPHGSFDLKNILHVPNASKNLLFVHRFTLDNHVFIEFHPFLFLIKDQATRRVLFRGPCWGGLYPLVPCSMRLPSMPSSQ
jgi:hypothetical protein